MPNDCWNRMTITCENSEAVGELNNLINNELKHKKGEKYVYHETVHMKQRGTRGIIFDMWSAWNPNYEWLESLLDKYPNCWVKNEWSEEGGFAGVWVGYFNNKNEKIVKQMDWDDICIEGKACLFNPEDEESKKEEEERQERINKRRAECSATGKRIIKKVKVDG